MATRKPPGRPKTGAAPVGSTRSGRGRLQTDDSGGSSHRPHIVGVGASASGIDAVLRLLSLLPVNTGLSFVIIQHLAPERPSRLRAVLARSTAMPVVDAENGMRPEADHVYVMPPGVDMALRDGLLVVAATAKDRKTPRSISRTVAIAGSASLAERASKAKDVFLALLSHELRAPLHTITLHADLLRAGAAADPDRSRAAAEAIGRAAEAQERIIGDLLDVSAIIAGKIAIKRRPVELQGVISAALGSIREVAARKQIQLRLEVDPSVGQVLGDDTRLQQIVGNLLGNAVKFTPEGGEIAIALDGAEKHARIRVIDRGEGIAGDFLPHVFDRFVQGDVSSTRSHGGLGLGLAIVRDLVRLHGGSVQADSEGPGRGATFTVELPLMGMSASDGDREEETDPRGHDALGIADLAADAARHEFAGVKLLLIDDDAESLEVMSEILRIYGAEVRTVERASEVICALAEFRPDVLLCDIAMPDEDGYSLIRRIRALPPDAGGRVPAVAVTAMATRSDRHRAIAAGFQLHLAKPAPVAALCDAVRRAHGLLVPHAPPSMSPRP